MADISSMAKAYRDEGYSDTNADARVCQDIVLKAISESSLSRNVTIKGGVVMRGISGNLRRATQDMDFDFIRYSLDESSIRAFIEKLNCLEGITIVITGDIEELSQQEYRGKRIHIAISDDTGHSLKSKIDLGVHKNIQIKQDEFCFDVCLDDEGASLLINSAEQIFTEKLGSLVRFGPLSTRYKDIFDMCYLTDYIEKDKLLKCIEVYILNNPDMREENINDIRKRISMVFSNKDYRIKVERSYNANWLRIKASVAFEKIETYLKKL